MVAKSFHQGVKELEGIVGDGELTGRVTVDQVYAHVQHEDLSPRRDGSVVPMKLRHPRGGGAKYLEGPLFDRKDDYLRNLADRALEPNGLEDAMAGNMEDLSTQVEYRAPVDMNVLRRSGHPQVFERNTVVYDRAPKAPREDL